MTPAVCECGHDSSTHRSDEWCAGCDCGGFTPRPAPAIMVGNDGLYGGSVEVSAAEETERLKAELSKVTAAGSELRDMLAQLHAHSPKGCTCPPGRKIWCLNCIVDNMLKRTAFLDGGEG